MKSSVVDTFRPHIFTILLHEIRVLWSITPFVWKKLNPFRVHFMRSFIPHVDSFYSPTWGFQKHNSYRVATPHNAFVMQYSTNCKIIFLRYERAKPVPGLFYTSIYSPHRLILFANVALSEAQLVPSCDVTQRVYNAI